MTQCLKLRDSINIYDFGALVLVLISKIDLLDISIVQIDFILVIMQIHRWFNFLAKLYLSKRL